MSSAMHRELSQATQILGRNVIEGLGCHQLRRVPAKAKTPQLMRTPWKQMRTKHIVHTYVKIHSSHAFPAHRKSYELFGGRSAICLLLKFSCCTSEL
eukprot:1192899-Prorocentrum_minimum.AAC.5